MSYVSILQLWLLPRQQPGVPSASRLRRNADAPRSGVFLLPRRQPPRKVPSESYAVSSGNCRQPGGQDVLRGVHVTIVRHTAVARPRSGVERQVGCGPPSPRSRPFDFHGRGEYSACVDSPCDCRRHGHECAQPWSDTSCDCSNPSVCAPIPFEPLPGAFGRAPRSGGLLSSRPSTT